MVSKPVLDLLAPRLESFTKEYSWEERTNSVVDFSVFVCFRTLMPKWKDAKPTQGQF